MLIKYFTKLENSKKELITKESIYRKMEIMFNENHRLLVLIDTILAPNSFDSIRSHFKEENIIDIPLAQGNNHKNCNLFFLEIVDKRILEKVGYEIAEHLSNNLNFDNIFYHVHGYGTSLYKNDVLNRKFKKTLVLQDINSKVLFRWYDPRVMIYFGFIFNEHQVNSLLGNFKQWSFVHPTGYLDWTKQNDSEFKKVFINKINEQQSLNLDLVEVANLVLSRLNEVKFEEITQVKPKKILKNLNKAYNEHGITSYVDLLAYGLYAEILGPQFMLHPNVQQILSKYWKVAPQQFNFTEAMDYLDQDLWVSIKNKSFSSGE